MHFPFLTISLLAGVLAFSACNDDEPVDINEEEVITTATLSLTPVGSGTPVILIFRDLDGDGGVSPTITGGILVANTTYTYDIVLLNEQETPPKNITTEVQAEGSAHQFFYRPTDIQLAQTYGDVDANGRPIGINGTMSAGAAGMGSLTVTLRHEPIKTAEGVAAGNIANANGETDVEVSYPVTIR